MIQLGSSGNREGTFLPHSYYHLTELYSQDTQDMVFLLF